MLNVRAMTFAVPPANTPRGGPWCARAPSTSMTVPSPPSVNTASFLCACVLAIVAACPGASVGMESQPTPASAKAFRAWRWMRAPRRDPGFTINSTRSILLGANLIAVAALMACQGLCEPAFPDSPATQDAARTLRLLSHIGVRWGQAGHYWMLGAGIEPAWDLIPRDFKSLASTDFATRAEKDEPARMGGTDPQEKRSGKRDSNPRPQPWQ